MELCSVKDCFRELKYRRLRLCRLHYNRFKRLGHTNLKVKQKDQVCKIKDCRRLVGLHGADGMCAFHYKKFWINSKRKMDN